MDTNDIRRTSNRCKRRLPSQADLHNLLRYDPKTGLLYWRKWKAGCRRNLRAGWQQSSGYIGIMVGDHETRAHRVVWKMIHGNDPAHIDHINGDRSDNRLKNLREAPNWENNRNLKLMKTNTSGVCGVSWDKSRNQWVAEIYDNGKKRFIGRYEEKVEAIAARHKAERELGYHRNHGT